MPDTPHDDAQDTRTPADPAVTAGAGVFSFADPGSAEAEAFDSAMADELDALDAEILARDGPDALTSDRAFRLSQYRATQALERQAALHQAERDSGRIGYVLAAFRAQRGWSAESLADWLGIAPDEYARLVAEQRPAYINYDGVGVSLDAAPLRALAERFGAHPERLVEAFERGDP
jgi:hypothetical protein